MKLQSALEKGAQPLGVLEPMEGSLHCSYT